MLTYADVCCVSRQRMRKMRGAAVWLEAYVLTYADVCCVPTDADVCCVQRMRKMRGAAVWLEAAARRRARRCVHVSAVSGACRLKVSIRQHTSAYVSIRHHTSAYVCGVCIYQRLPVLAVSRYADVC
jgi:hypothetical protein